jgi:hypothetical protein
MATYTQGNSDKYAVWRKDKGEPDTFIRMLDTEKEALKFAAQWIKDEEKARAGNPFRAKLPMPKLDVRRVSDQDQDTLRDQVQAGFDKGKKEHWYFKK